MEHFQLLSLQIFFSEPLISFFFWNFNWLTFSLCLFCLKYILHCPLFPSCWILDYLFYFLIQWFIHLTSFNLTLNPPTEFLMFIFTFYFRSYILFPTTFPVLLVLRAPIFILCILFLKTYNEVILVVHVPDSNIWNLCRSIYVVFYWKVNSLSRVRLFFMAAVEP